MKYIGQTTGDVKTRIDRGYSPTSQIGAAIQTYGIGNFTYQILKAGITTQESLDDWENHYIGFHGTLLNGYNERLA